MTVIQFMTAKEISFIIITIDGLVQVLSISTANALEILKSCTKASICDYFTKCATSVTCHQTYRRQVSWTDSWTESRLVNPSCPVCLCSEGQGCKGVEIRLQCCYNAVNFIQNFHTKDIPQLSTRYSFGVNNLITYIVNKTWTPLFTQWGQKTNIFTNLLYCY